MLKALGWANVRVDIHNEGVTDALVLTYLNLASSIVCQKQSNGNASQGVLYTALIGFELKKLVGREGELYIYIYVGLSTLYWHCISVVHWKTIFLICYLLDYQQVQESSNVSIILLGDKKEPTK